MIELEAGSMMIVAQTMRAFRRKFKSSAGSNPSRPAGRHPAHRRAASRCGLPVVLAALSMIVVQHAARAPARNARLHRVGGAALGQGADGGGVAEHFGQRHFGVDGGLARAWSRC